MGPQLAYVLWSCLSANSARWSKQKLAETEGLSAEACRRSPDRLRRTASAESSLMMRSMSTDDEFFDPGVRRRQFLKKDHTTCQARLLAKLEMYMYD
ncbi:hypothetical protein TELCIR_21691, partial [Teladorsagia circumcincta]